MANLGVVSFNGGKFTPLVDVRSDVEKYASGCRECQNMIPLIHGPVTRRPGFKYIANCIDDDVVSRVVSFVYSATIAYEIEFSALKMTVYYLGTALADSSEIVTPYTEADLPALQFRQSADVMWVVHPSYQPRKITRTNVTTFAINTITIDDGPFIERNDIAEDDDVTIKAVGYTIATATLGAVQAGEFTITSATDISSYFPTNRRFYVDGSTGNDDAYTVYTASYAATTLTLVPNEAVATSDNDGEIQVEDGVVTLTASAATFTTGTSGHTGALFKLTHKRLVGVTKGSATGTGVVGQAIDVKGNFTFATGGNWDATVEIQRLEDGTNWERFRSYTSVMVNGVGSRNVQKSHVEKESGVQYRINVTAYTDGTLEADITVDESTQDSVFRITATGSTVSATATAIVPAPENTVTKRWAEGTWSHVRGWPSAITFFGERVVYGFTNSDAQDIWLSRVGKFEIFEAGINDSDSFALTLPTANRGRWLGSLEALIIGTTGDEWRIRASALDQALTPQNFDIKKQTSFGGANIQALEVNEAIIFIDFVARKVREHTFSDPKQKYVSPDLTALAEDITSGGITSAAVQKNPDPIIWFTITNSPYLLSMTYEREQNVVALAEHPVGGEGACESVTVSPSTSEDRITATIQRTVNEATVRYIEEMQPRDWGSTTDATDAFFVDSGLTDESGSTTVAVAHLKGETVAILADGVEQDTQEVINGNIILDAPPTKVTVGLPYESKVSPMRLDVTTTGGTTHGSIKDISEIVVSFFATGSAQHGDGDDTRDFSEVKWDPPTLFTGDIVEVPPIGLSRDDTIVISTSSPLPMTVRAIVARTEKVGR